MAIARRGQKKDLKAIKETLLKEISDLNHTIELARSNADRSNSQEMEDSSDSEVELCLREFGPSVVQLKQEQSMLRTRLQATQELRRLELLQHEVNVLVSEPEVLGASAVKEPGLWREVTAECCIDIVPFSITFLTHQPYRKFSAASYHRLQVVPLKNAHEVELGASVLSELKTPSDATEVLMSYAAANRSRRSTLARLADKFGNLLHMEPIPEGGYMLKCADLLELSWTLQNKWSPIAPFHHKMKFDLEYMDEQHIKIIKQAHRQLIEPAVDTDERTLLLAKIIEICLKVKYGEGYEQVLENEVMAPPKSLPKKVKSKNNKKNVNTSANGNTGDDAKRLSAVKRSAVEENDSNNVKQPKAVKKSAVEENDSNNAKQPKAVKKSAVEENDSNNAKQPKAAKKSAVEENDSNNAKQPKAVKKSAVEENDSNNAKQPKAVKKSVVKENDGNNAKQQKAGKRYFVEENDNNEESAKKMKTKDSTNSINAVKEPIINENQDKITEKVGSSVNNKPEKSIAPDGPKRNVATSKNKVKSASEKSNVNSDDKTKTDETAKSNAEQNSAKTTEKTANNVGVEKAGAKNKTVKSAISKNNVENSEKGKNDEVTIGKDVNGDKDPKPNKVKSVENTKQAKNLNEPQTSKTKANNDDRRGTYVVAGSVASVNNKPSVANEKKQAQNTGGTKNGNPQQNISKKVNSAKKINENANNVNNVNPNTKKVNKNSENKSNEKPNDAKKVVKPVNSAANVENSKKSDKNPMNANKVAAKTLNRSNLPKNDAIKKNTESKIPKNTAAKIAGSVKNQNGDNSSKNSGTNTTGILKSLKPNINKIGKTDKAIVKTTKVIPSNLKRVDSGNTEKENVQKRIIQKPSKVPQMPMTSTPKMVNKAPLRISPRKPIPKKPLVGSNVKNLSKPASSTNIPRLITNTKPKMA